LQGVAILFAALAVLLLTWGLGVAPWIALGLAASFSLYSLTKKGMKTDATASVTLEVLLLVPFAVAYLIWLHMGQGQGSFGREFEASWMLPLSGAITAGPLILFSAGAQNIRLSTLGLAQYLNPTLQVLCAALIMGDSFTLWHGLALSLIWVALAFYTAETLRQDRRAANAASNSGTSFTTAK
jgi:chloramphenicol-sensitive protein RarD